jgi:hypothetical protein
MECKVSKKISANHVYSAKELKKEMPSVLIDESSSGTTVSRCGFTPSAGKVTCDPYEIDKVEVTERLNLFTSKPERIKKFYLFRAQFDVQVFPDLTFIENNGRGIISFGTCALKGP